MLIPEIVATTEGSTMSTVASLPVKITEVPGVVGWRVIEVEMVKLVAGS